MAPEPFLVHLEKLSGLYVKYESVHLESMRYHAFADDVNIYRNERDNDRKTARIIEDYEKVSNSPVSHTKSRLVGFGSNFEQLEQDRLPFPRSYIGEENTKYLGIPLQGVDWNSFISKLAFMAFQLGYSMLDVISRAKGTVTFVSSKAVYKDLVQCMKDGRCYQKGVCG